MAIGAEEFKKMAETALSNATGSIKKPTDKDIEKAYTKKKADLEQEYNALSDTSRSGVYNEAIENEKAAALMRFQGFKYEPFKKETLNNYNAEVLKKAQEELYTSIPKDERSLRAAVLYEKIFTQKGGDTPVTVNEEAVNEYNKPAREFQLSTALQELEKGMKNLRSYLATTDAGNNITTEDFDKFSKDSAKNKEDLIDKFKVWFAGVLEKVGAKSIAEKIRATTKAGKEKAELGGFANKAIAYAQKSSTTVAPSPTPRTQNTEKGGASPGKNF